LPDATASAKGIIKPGTGLVANGGTLNHSNSVTAGTYTKLTVDAQGHTTAGALLDATDIPNIDAAKITSGELPTARLADNAVTIDKLSDYSTASLGEAFPTPSFIGQIHLNPLDKSFFMWDGNVFVPIGISAGQIIFAGTFNAASPSGTGKIASVTPEGAAAGFTVNSALPASAPGNNKHYLVVSTGGTITSGNAPNVTLAPPDIILSVYNSTSPGWVELDVSSGAGSIAATQVSFASTPDVGSSNVQSAIEEVSTECRNATNLTSGTLAVARGGTNLASYTKGDLIAASAATTLNKLAVGTNTHVLRANSATATGLEWGADFVGTVTTVSSSTAALTVATATTTPALTIRSATTSVDGIVQLSDSTSTTSSVLAATPTAVKSAYDIAAAALPKAGGTVTGDITMGVNIGIQFEGATDDANEIRLIAADPTADRTITLPNVTGTVVTTGDSGTVTSTMLLDGTILNADVNASAAIAGTKVSPDFGSQTIVTTGVFSSAAGTAAAPSIAFTGDLNTGIYSPGADQLAVSTGGTGRLFVDANGRVGIGTSSPAYGLHLSGTNATSATAQITTTATSDAGVRTTTSLGTFAFGTGIGSATKCWNVYDVDNSAERLRIDSSGRVGIGTSSPTVGYLLDCRGNVKFGSSSTTGVYLGVDSNIPFIQGFDSGATYNQLKFLVGATEAVRIDSSGNVGIGTSAPAAKTEIVSSGSESTLILRNGSSSASTYSELKFAPFTGTTAASASIRTTYTQDNNSTLEFRTTAAAAEPVERLRIRANGEVVTTTSFNTSFAGTTTGTMAYDAQSGVGSAGLLVMLGKGNDGAGTGGVSLSRSATSWASYSDERAKTNLVAINDGLNKVSTLRSVTGRYIDDEPGTSRSFLIAQDVQAVLPEAVDAGDPDRLNLRYAEVIPLLVAALKESKERIETLEAAVAALQSA
jgi:hypothetical protein